MEETKDLVKQFLSKEGLQYYDGKIKGYVAEQIADAKEYADGLATNYDAAGSAAAAEAAAKAYADSLVADEDGSRFDAAGSAAQALADAKAEMETRGLKEGQVLGTAAYADTTDFDAAGSAAQALTDAKAYADGLATNYDAAGSAAQALTDAKAYADGLATNYDAAGTAEGLNTAMDARVKVLEAIDHEKLAADASAAAVAAIVDGASDSFDTLKEVADWIANNEHAEDVATLVTDVANLKAIDHDAYKGADETVLANAKAYTDTEIDEISKVTSEAFADLKEVIGTNEEFGLDFTGTNKLGECSSIMDAIRVLDEESKDADGSYSALEARVKANEDNKAEKSVVEAMYTNEQIDGFVNAKANAADVYTKEEVYTKAEVEAMVITNEEIDALFAVAAE